MILIGGNNKETDTDCTAVSASVKDVCISRQHGVSSSHRALQPHTPRFASCPALLRYTSFLTVCKCYKFITRPTRLFLMEGGVRFDSEYLQQAGEREEPVLPDTGQSEDHRWAYGRW